MPLLFAVTLFVSAFLLFLVQPMIAQMILPRLGGTPAVWNTCMVFFQAALLAGYGYTHSATTYMPVKRQTLVQGGLLMLPLLLLPFRLGDWAPATEVNPIWSVLYILLIVVGIPFFVVATSAPLLQRWFASTGHPSSKDPYFLYGASNFGSMLALVSYPFVFQRIFALADIAWVWSAVYIVMIALVAFCGLIVWRAPQTATMPAVPEEKPAAPVPVPQAQQHITRRPGRRQYKPLISAPVVAAPKTVSTDLTWPRRLRWVGLAAAPTSLMLGLTTYLTTDIAAIPLFWIVPLALYLLSFILVFARWPVPWTRTPHRLFVYFQPVALMALGMLYIALQKFGAWGLSEVHIILIHLTAFFACVMVCHGELAKDRPAAKHLTEFYLWMSVGGVIGGLFNSLIAPVIFKDLVEYMLVLMLVVFLRPQTHFWEWIRKKKEPPDDHTLQEYLLDLGYAACLGLLAYALLRLSQSESLFGRVREDVSESVKALTFWIRTRLVENFGFEARGTSKSWQWAHWIELFITAGIPFAICIGFAGRPVRIGLAVIGLFIANYFMLYQGETNVIYANRSFFSVQRVRRDYESRNGETYNVLIHGGIDHGRQNVDPSKRDRPISYFLPTNPIGQIFTQLKAMDLQMPPDKKLPFAVVGLGAGTLASYGNPGQVVHFYEIDPAVLRLSGYEMDPNGKLRPLPDGYQPLPVFFYLHDAMQRGVKLDLFLGDGRLKLNEEKAPDEKKNFYQVIVLDAFSSDAIPVHLLTKEAIQMYLTKLREDGILIFNITNRYVRMAPVLADAARELDLICLQQGDYGDANNPESFGTDWVIMFRKKDAKKTACEVAAIAAAIQPDMISSIPWVGLMGAPKIDFPHGLPERLDEWRWERQKDTGRPAWTDNFQDLVRAMNWGVSMDEVLVMGAVMLVICGGFVMLVWWHERGVGGQAHVG